MPAPPRLRRGSRHDLGTAAAFGLGVASSIVADVIYDRYKDPASRRTILSSIDPAAQPRTRKDPDMPTRRKTAASRRRKITSRRDKAQHPLREQLHAVSGELRDIFLALDREVANGRLRESDAIAIDDDATWVAEMAARIIADARAASRNSSGRTVVAKVRKALGFTRP